MGYVKNELPRSTEITNGQMHANQINQNPKTQKPNELIYAALSTYSFIGSRVLAVTRHTTGASTALILDIDHVFLVVHSATTAAGVVVLVHAITTDATAVPVTTITKARFALATKAADAVTVHVSGHKPLLTVPAAASIKLPSVFPPSRPVDQLHDNKLALVRHKHQRSVFPSAHLVAQKHVRRGAPASAQAPTPPEHGAVGHD